MNNHYNQIQGFYCRNSKILFIIVLILLTVSFRVLLMHHTLQHPADPQLINTNGEVARNIIEGNGLVINNDTLKYLIQNEKEEGRLINPEEVASVKTSTSLQPFYNNGIGYPLFLSLVWGITGQKYYFFPIIIQILLAGLAAICVFQMAQEIMPFKFAALSGFFYAFYLPEAKLNVLPFQYAWIGLIAVFSTWLLTKIRQPSNSKKIYFFIILLGLLYGIGGLMRSTLVLLPFIGAGIIFLSFSFKRAIKLSLLMFICFMLIIAPYFFYNKISFGEERVVRKTFWHSVAVGLGQFPNPWGFLPIDESVRDFVSKHNSQLIEPFYPNDKSEEFLKNTIKTAILANPFWYLGTIIERIPMAIFPFHWAITRGIVQVKYLNNERVFYTVPYDSKVIFGTFLLSGWIMLALIGMYLMRKKWFFILPLLGIWLYFIAVYSILFVHPVYLYPIGFVYAVFSSYALYRLQIIWKQKQIKRNLNVPI